MFLHLNLDFFAWYFPLSFFYKWGKRKLVSTWTPFLSASYDYYAFSDYFITLVLHDLIRKGNIIWLDKEKTRYMRSFTLACDWFLGTNFTILWMWGFTSQPFLLPTHVIDRVLTLEMYWQVCIIDFTLCSRKSVKKKGFFSCLNNFKLITLIKKQPDQLLEDKLTYLGLVLVNDKWEYNLFNEFSKLHMKVTHVPWSYWEKRHNPQEDKDENLVELARITTQDTRGPWHKF